MKNLIIILLSFVSVLLNGCDILSSSDVQKEEFFPLKVDQHWTYIRTDSDMDTSRISFPKQFTVSVVGEMVLSGEKYFLISNYFVPGPKLPDTIYARTADNRVFIRFSPKQEDYLFYSFNPSDSIWSVPMYVNPSTLNPREATLITYSNSIVAVSWDLFGYPNNPPFTTGRTESGWGETFKRGVGRTEIYSISQAYGKIVWKIQNFPL